MKYVKMIVFSMSMISLAIACGGDTDNSNTKRLPNIETTVGAKVKEVLTAIPLVSQNERIALINYTDYATKDLESWIQLASSKMKTRKSRIFAFIYPVGERKEPEETIRSDHADNVFAKHEVLITQSQIDLILDSVQKWFDNDRCIGGQRPLKDYRTWLEQGGDTSTMHVVCPTVRVVAMGVTAMMREREPLSEFQSFLIHEFYHAFQQDLSMEGECEKRRNMENSNTRWFVEGAAHYFATVLTAQLNNDQNPYSKILQIAYAGLERESDYGLYEGGPDKTGAAALRLMVERGLLEEKVIMDGSLFHNCARELTFDSTSPKMQDIRTSWKLIKKRGDTYVFKPEALKNGSN